MEQKTNPLNPSTTHGWKRYECMNCKSIIWVPMNRDPNNYKCPPPCKNTYGASWTLLTTAYTKEEWDNELEELKTLYYRIRELLERYMDMNDHNLHLTTLWIIGTYIYEEFNTFPLLFINAVRGSGKTRLLLLIESLAWNGKIQANLKEAVLFRTKKKHTMIIDEFEQVGNKELGTIRELLNASYKRSAKVERLKEVVKEGKKDYAVESFDLFSPLAMANIWGMDETVQDRCIVIHLDKSNDPSKTRLLEDFQENPLFLQLRSLLSNKQCSLCSVVSEKRPTLVWNDYISQLHKTTLNTLTTYNTLTTQTTLDSKEGELEREKLLSICKKIDEMGIYGRDLELFFPLFILSYVFGEEIFMKTLIIAKHQFDAKTNEEFSENPDVILLDFLYRTYKDEGITHIDMSRIVSDYKVRISAEEVSAKSLGRSLARLNVILDKKRESYGVKIMLDLAKIHQKLERYSKT